MMYCIDKSYKLPKLHTNHSMYDTGALDLSNKTLPSLQFGILMWISCLIVNYISWVAASTSHSHLFLGGWIQLHIYIYIMGNHVETQI